MADARTSTGRPAIACDKPGCPRRFWSPVRDARSIAALPPGAPGDLRTRALRRGWAVAIAGGRDVCPDHTKAAHG